MYEDKIQKQSMQNKWNDTANLTIKFYSDATTLKVLFTGVNVTIQ